MWWDFGGIGLGVEGWVVDGDGWGRGEEVREDLGGVGSMERKGGSEQKIGTRSGRSEQVYGQRKRIQQHLYSFTETIIDLQS